MFSTVLKSFGRQRPSALAARKFQSAAFSTSTPASSRPWEDSKILLTGCQGQIGVPLARALCEELGAENVMASDATDQKFDFPCKFTKLDVVDADAYARLVNDNKINYVVHLAGILSALGEMKPDLAVDVNVTGVINAIRVANATNSKLFVPSSIAAFGGDIFPKDMTPVQTILQPRTIYGVGKVFNEMIGEYYKRKMGMDFRCIRYPGVISSEKFAFNGTTDYSTEIFFHALENNYYKCWIDKDTAMPMIYIDDCITATVKFLKADSSRLQNTVYNLAGISFTAGEFCGAVQQIIPGLKVDFEPDFRQQIAESWPNSLDDTESYRDWDWKYDISTKDLAERILAGIDDKYKQGMSTTTSSQTATSSRASMNNQ